jgi:hypothetical protein
MKKGRNLLCPGELFRDAPYDPDNPELPNYVDNLCFSSNGWQLIMEDRPYFLLPPTPEFNPLDLTTRKKIDESPNRRFPYLVLPYYYDPVPPHLFQRIWGNIKNWMTYASPGSNRFHTLFLNLEPPKTARNALDLELLLNWCKVFGPPVLSETAEDGSIKLYVDDFIEQLALAKWIVALHAGSKRLLPEAELDALIDQLSDHDRAVKLLCGFPSYNCLNSEIGRYNWPVEVDDDGNKILVGVDASRIHGKRIPGMMQTAAWEEATQIVNTILNRVLDKVHIRPIYGYLSVFADRQIDFIYFMLNLDWNMGKIPRKCENRHCSFYFTPSRNDQKFCCPDCVRRATAQKHSLQRTKARALFRVGLSNESIIAEIRHHFPTSQPTVETILRWTGDLQTSSILPKDNPERIVHALRKANFSESDIQRIMGFTLDQIKTAK